MSSSRQNKIKQCDLSLPNLCMLQCRMCNIWQNDISVRNPDWLGLEEYRRLLHQLKEDADDPCTVSLSGGEPLFMEYALDILSICKELGFTTYFPTSAYLINEPMVKRMKDAGVSCIGLSLDSLNEKTHDAIRGKQGCWQRAMQAIRLLEQHYPEIAINILTVIMAINLDDILPLAHWTYRHPQLHGIVFQAIEKPLNSSWPNHWYQLPEFSDLWPSESNKVNAILDDLITLRRNHDRGYKVCNPVQQLAFFKQYFRDPAGFVKPSSCHLGQDVVRIDALGNVALCNEMDAVGNIKAESISEIWRSKKAQETRDRIRNCVKNHCYHIVNCFYDGSEG